jgi:hypothetical protein
MIGDLLQSSGIRGIHQSRAVFAIVTQIDNTMYRLYFTTPRASGLSDLYMSKVIVDDFYVKV